MPTSHDNKTVSARSAALKILTFASVLSLAVCASGSSIAATQAPDVQIDPAKGDSPSSAFCSQSLSALQQAGLSGQSGHLEALKTLEACYTRLGQTDRAELTHRRIYQEINRGDPHDW